MMGFFVLTFLKMHFLYIIFSESLDRYYVGETHNIDERLQKHKNHSYKGGFTKSANDWKLVLINECLSRNDALFLEKFIKRMKSKIFIKRVIQDSNILSDILNKKSL